MAYLTMQCVHNSTYIEKKNEVIKKINGSTGALSYIRYSVKISYGGMIF
jgi:hypothetical protein